MTTLLHKAAAPAAVTTTEPQAADPVSAPAPAPVPASGTGAAAAVSAATTTESATDTTTTEPPAVDPVSAPAPAPVPASGTGAAAAVSAVTTTETETQPEVALYVVFIFPLRHLFCTLCQVLCNSTWFIVALYVVFISPLCIIVSDLYVGSRASDGTTTRGPECRANGPVR